MDDQTQPPGAFPTDAGVRYRVWAPEKRSADAIVNGSERIVALQPAGDGFFQGTDPDGRAGDLYKFRLDGFFEGTDPDGRAGDLV